MTILVRFYGGLRDYSEQITLEGLSEEALTAADIKNMVLERMSLQYPYSFDRKLVELSAVATHDRILAGSEELLGVSEVSLLPPVCGG